MDCKNGRISSSHLISPKDNSNYHPILLLPLPSPSHCRQPIYQSFRREQGTPETPRPRALDTSTKSEEEVVLTSRALLLRLRSNFDSRGSSTFSWRGASMNTSKSSRLVLLRERAQTVSQTCPSRGFLVGRPSRYTTRNVLSGKSCHPSLGPSPLRPSRGTLIYGDLPVFQRVPKRMSALILCSSRDFQRFAKV